MQTFNQMARELAAIPFLSLRPEAPLSEYTRFGIGGPAALYAESDREAAFVSALEAVRRSGLPWVVIGGGTNLVATDEGYRGVVLRLTSARIAGQDRQVEVDAGAVLQDLVDFTASRGWKGLETMTGIPGSVGGAIYGNAGAYGHSIMECVEWVRFFDGSGVRTFSNAECGFAYRESRFKGNKDWVILSASLRLGVGQAPELMAAAAEILAVRNEKYPPTMQCAGSIFKNLLWAELPEGARAGVPAKVVREGKVPSAWFLEQVGAKGMRRGQIAVAEYHANLIYNTGGGLARELLELTGELKDRVRRRFGFDLEEEVQFVG